MNTIQIGNITRETPSSWDELTRQQLLDVAGMFYKKITIRDFRVQMIFKFLNIKLKEFKKLTNEEAYALSETLEFLTKEVTLTRQLIPRILKYHGPSDGLRNIIFREFINANLRYDDYIKNGKKSELDELVAVLYRRKKVFWWIRKHFSPDTDPRQKLIEKTIEKRGRKLKGVSQEVKYAVYLFFSGVFHSLSGMFPRTFRQRSETSRNDGKGWISLVISLAEGKTDHRSIDRVLDSNMYNVFFGLEEKAKQYEKHLDEIKKIQNKAKS